MSRGGEETQEWRRDEEKRRRRGKEERRGGREERKRPRMKTSQIHKHFHQCQYCIAKHPSHVIDVTADETALAIMTKAIDVKTKSGEVWSRNHAKHKSYTSSTGRMILR